MQFARLADREGVGHTLAVGLPIEHAVTGALNIYGYRSSGMGFPQQMRVAAAGFATYAAAAVTNAALFAQASGEAAQLRSAMKSCAVIEQAKGMIMQSQHCDAEQAFLLGQL